MTRKVILAAGAALVLAGLLPGLIRPARALPVYARKYGFECTMCHSNVPRLNDFGQRYRMNGYQLPGRESEDKDVLHSPAPFALRTTFGATYSAHKNAMNQGTRDLRRFQLNTLDLLSGGLLGRNISYLVVYTPPLDSSRGVAGQVGSLEMANVVFSNLLCGARLNLRVGRFEPAYMAFSSARRLTVSPYEAYNFTFRGGAPMTQTQEGVEVYGYDRRGWYWAAGAVNGPGTADTGKVSADFYARGFKVFGPGWGQTAGQRVGISAYYGRAYPVLQFAGELFPGEGWLYPLGSQEALSVPDYSKRYNYFRLGADASLNIAWVNLSVQYLLGMDRRELWLSAASKNYLLHHSGFLEASLMPTDKIVGFARFDIVKPDKPAQIGQGEITRYTAGMRYYFAYNLALHLEYSHRQEQRLGENPEAKEDFATMRLDFAF
jgi:hypothetical protein